MNDQERRILAVPRGVTGTNPLELDMGLIDEADRRLQEVRVVSQNTRNELAGLYNQAANQAGKYLGWVEYEILRVKKQIAKIRSNIIASEEMYAEAKKLKELGMKMNEDIRESIISKDPLYDELTDRRDALEAVKVMLGESKWSFIRAFNSLSEGGGRDGAPTPNFVGEVGQTYLLPQPNFMGKDERKK